MQAYNNVNDRPKNGYLFNMAPKFSFNNTCLYYCSNNSGKRRKLNGVFLGGMKFFLEW